MLCSALAVQELYITFAIYYQILDVFSSDNLKDQATSASKEEVMREREDNSESVEETEERWSKVYGRHSIHKPHQFIGSISEIINKLPEGLQISRVRKVVV